MQSMDSLIESGALDRRQPCVFFMSCIGAAPKYFMQLSDEFRARYRVIPYLFNNKRRLPEMLPIVLDELQRSPLLIYHEPDWMPYLGTYLDAYEEFLDAIPGHVSKISVPQPGFWSLWPFHCSDPRNAQADRPRNRYGTLPSFAYGDTYVQRLLKQGLPPDEVVSRYLAVDLATEIDLDNLLRGSIARLERQDRGSTVKIAAFVNDNFRSKQLFQTINHANNRLNHYMANQALEQLQCEAVPESALESVTEIIERPSPVHPSIARHYGISYIDEDTRYPIDEVRNLTFAEYIDDYVRYEHGILNYKVALINNPMVAFTPPVKPSTPQTDAMARERAPTSRVGDAAGDSAKYVAFGRR
jgi:hypothetical protein